VAFVTSAWEKSPIRILSSSADATVQARWRTITAQIFAGDSYNNDSLTPKRYATGGISDFHGNAVAILHITFRRHAVCIAGQQPWEHIHHLRTHRAPYVGNLAVQSIFMKSAFGSACFAHNVSSFEMDIL
jgi:hypothetical protein